MYSKKNFIVVVITFLTIQFSFSQNNTNSPYTRFGYGDITESAPTELRGMGGTSIANHSKSTINPINPASYSGVDSMTFMFDIGAGLRYSRFSDLNTTGGTMNANLEYITMRFPLAKSLGFSAGLLPYSFVGYAFSLSDSISMPVAPSETPRKIGYTQSYLGSGGFYQVYTGLGYKMFNHVALGVNAYYLFGNANNYRSVYVSSASASTTYNNQITASDFRLRYGLQFFNTFNKKHDVSLGFIFENKTKLNGNFYNVENDTTIVTDKKFELPMTFGVGLNYRFNNKLTIGMDYKLQSWKDAEFFSKKDSLVNASTFSIGAEYIPNPLGRKKTDRFKYRIGLNTSNPYYKVGTQTLPNNVGISLGVGIPMRDNFSNRVSYVNAALEYGKMGSNSTLREDYLKLTFSAMLDELWFFKRKL